MPPRPAPGWPGMEPRWTSSAKTGVGTALSPKSRVWFTLSHGIFNEIYYPRIDQACTRDLGFVVTSGTDFFSEEKRDAGSHTHWLSEGAPAYRLVNTCFHDRYRVEKEVVTDPHRDVVLQQTLFVPQQGKLSDYRLYALLAPHLGNEGYGNNAWIGEFKGQPLLFAQRDGCALALACSVPWLKASAGYVGASDGWQDLKSNLQLTQQYTNADNGNTALTGEIDLQACDGRFLLALGFGATPEEAAQNAQDSLKDGFDKAQRDYIAGWQAWLKTHSKPLTEEPGRQDLARASVAVLRTHESKSTPGALIASLAIPWGFSKGDNDIGGYHLVWARDMVETAGALLALGCAADVLRSIGFLKSTQKDDGHWPQNMWLDGSPYWNGIQMDETALPILLLDLACREKALPPAALADYWPMARKAAGYIARNGPVSPQDRWEEDPGYTPFTLGAEIAGLLAAADMADLRGEGALATYLRETADAWNDCLERWMYVSGTDWCERFLVEGYYVRIAPDAADPSTPENVLVKNVPPGQAVLPVSHLVSPDALALVRFGLRAADDPRILDTVKVIDALLKVDTSHGPLWHRYNGDGYGEHEDGSPFDGTGVGRGWPLLTGERAHYELAAGRADNARRLMEAVETFANEGGLIPEQVWDAPDIPDRELYFGKPSGSAMPLVWAHAEYLKLRRSLKDGRVFDMPPQTVKRYLVDKTRSPRMLWRFNHKIRSIVAGKSLRVELGAPAVVHWSLDGWKTAVDTKTRDTGIGMHIVDLPVDRLKAGQGVVFTFYWPQADRWEGTDFTVLAAGS